MVRSPGCSGSSGRPRPQTPQTEHTPARRYSRPWLRVCGRGGRGPAWARGAWACARRCHGGRARGARLRPGAAAQAAGARRRLRAPAGTGVRSGSGRAAAYRPLRGAGAGGGARTFIAGRDDGQNARGAQRRERGLVGGHLGARRRKGGRAADRQVYRADVLGGRGGIGLAREGGSWEAGRGSGLRPGPQAAAGRGPRGGL